MISILRVDGVPEQACAPFGEGVIDVVVDLRQVDARFGEHGDGAVEVGREEREREIARVGHHADVHRLGHGRGDGPGAAQTLDDFIDDERGARSVGVRKHQLEARIRGQMMVDQHAPGGGVGFDDVAQVFQARDGVEVEAEDQVGLLHGAGGAPLGVGFIDDHLPDAGHPVEEIGVFVGHHAQNPVSHAAQDFGPCERRSDGIPVGIGMRDDHDTPARLAEQVVQTQDRLFIESH